MVPLPILKVVVSIIFNIVKALINIIKTLNFLKNSTSNDSSCCLLSLTDGIDNHNGKLF